MYITAITGSRALDRASSGRKNTETLRVFTRGVKSLSLLHVPKPISDLTTQVFGVKKDRVDIDSAADLKKHSLVMNRGVIHGLNITQGLKNFHVLPSSSLLALFLRLESTGYGLAGHLNGEHLIRASNIRNIVLIGQPLKVLALYHYIYTKTIKSLSLRSTRLIRQW
jgi:hypothetical protein